MAALHRGEVVGLLCDRDLTGDGLEVKDNTADSREQHVLTVRLKGGKPGEFSRTVKVLTDIKDEGAVEFRAKGQVVP